GMRLDDDTGTNLTSSRGSFSSLLIASATRRQRSTEYPCGCFCASRNENGTLVSRTPIDKVPVSRMRRSVSICSAGLSGVAATRGVGDAVLGGAPALSWAVAGGANDAIVAVATITNMRLRPDMNLLLQRCVLPPRLF